MKSIRFLLGGVGLQLTLAVLVSHAWPGCQFIFHEDQLLENLTALFFLAAGIMGIWSMVRRAGHRKLYLAVAVLGVVGFLDEMSFGERHLELDMPQVAGKKVDAIHDLVSVAISVVRSSPIAAVLTIVLVLVIGALGFRVLSLRLQVLLGLVRKHPPYAALTVSAGLVFLAVLLDVHLVRFATDRAVEETLEMNAGLILAFVSFLPMGAEPSE